ncbi:HTH-type transcriptional regulator TreR [Kosakonia sp. SMBL-WEM22]|uniref:trehalose operon repressor TreR n=1 Tax=Kosakonia sp. SMBL-WEM22 TaxID=2725560 RepID=UPI001659CDBC|nr:trehalose operon repressor TreR [Kosakonia sp. SMBL-WEM22]MDV5355531.1 trehalose operon repressor TreR [Enterobacter asburiae]QNQ19312.1 HTH-type transcriptional regulator TreR [Kosakonia sp. SMBL-WEM22]
MSDKKLTLNDIAKLCGVGKSTVSLVINNSDKVKKATRERVEAIIKEQGYTPSKAAQALRSQREKIIGVIVTRLDSASENQAIRAILPQIYQHEYDAILMESLLDPTLLAAHLNVLAQRNVEGVILFGFSGVDKHLVKGWKDKLVLISSALPEVASVVYDNVGAVNVLMEKMRDEGHRSVAYIGVTTNDPTTGNIRYQTYLERCEAFGMTPHAALGDLSYQSGYDLAKGLLTAESGALICASDTIAMGAIKYIQQQGWKIKVGSIGSTPLMTFLQPDVLSVKMGYQQAGLKASQLLLEMLHGTRTQEHIVIPCTFQ